MSASKKKRMGSQRRPLNPNLQESPKTSDTVKSPPVPKRRQRADARADLTPGSAEFEIPARKSSSNPGSEEELHYKDVTSESSLKPCEEVVDATYSQDPYFLGLKNESIDESLEKNSAPGSGLADFDLLLNESSNVSISTVTEAISSMPQTSDTLDTNMETKSDLLLIDGQNKKYLKPKIASTQEGVPEKDLAQQMSDILEATLPAGVTGENTCSVSLTGQEDINITGSHECTNTINSGEAEVGHIEKPVCQQSDKSSLPVAKIRKLGSSRRGKGTSIKGLQHQGDDISANVLEKTDLTIVQNTQDVTVDTPAEDIYRDAQLNMNQTIKDDLSVDSRSLLEVKKFEKPQVVELLADFKDQEEEKNIAYEKVVDPQDFSELSSIEITPMDDTKAPQSSPHPEITVSVGVEEVKIVEIGDYSTQQVLGETDEPAENITIEDSLTSGITATLKDDTYSKDNTFDNDFFATDKEFKDEIVVRSGLSSNMPSELETGKSSIKDFITTKDELSELMFGAQMGMQSSTEELLHFDQNDNSDLLNVSASPKLEDKNEMHAAQTENVCQVTSSVSVTDEDKYNSSVDATNIKDSFSEYKEKDLIEQPLETLNTFTDGVSTVPDQIYTSENQEENVKLSDESQSLNKEDIIALPNTSLDDVCDDTDKYITAEEFLKTDTIATVVQESVLKTYPEENVNNDLFDTGEGNHEIDEKCFKEVTIESGGSEELDMLLHSKDEVITEPNGEQPEIHATTTELQNKEYNTLNVTTWPEFDVSSSVNVTHEGVDDNSASFIALGESTDNLFLSATNSGENERDGSGSTNNVVILEPESLISLTLSTDSGQEDQETIKPAVEQVVDLQSVKSSEPQEPQIQQTVNADTSLTSPHPKATADVQDEKSSALSQHRRKLGSSRKIKGRKQVNDELKPEEKSEEIITPIDLTEKTQTEAVLHKQGGIGATDIEEHKDKVDKGLSQLVYDEPQETVEETNDGAILSSENLLQQEPPSTDISNDGQSEDNEPKVYVEEEKHTLPNNELDFVQVQEDLPEVDDGENQPKELNKSNDNVQIPHMDDINAPLTSPHPDVSVDVEDVTSVGSQFIGNRRKLGSSRRTREQKQDNIESKKQEIDITPNEKIEIPQVACGIEKESQDIAIDSDIIGKELDQSFIQVHDETLETAATTSKYLKPTEVTALFEEEQTVENNASKDRHTLPNIIDSIIENVIPEQSKVDSLFRQESPTDLQNTEQSEVKTGIYALKEPINVHQLTYISDNETHEEIDNSFLLQAEQPVQGETNVEPSEAVPLVHVTKVNEPNADLAHGPRRKLGSSRRMKERKLANNEKSNDSEDIGKVTELVQSTPIEDLLQQELNDPNFASEVAAELTKEDNSKPEDAKDTMFLLSDKEQETVSSEEKENNIQEKSIVEGIQKEITVVDSFTVKDLKDKAVAEADSTPEETVKAETEDTIHSVVMSAKDQQDVQDMKVLLTTAESQINSEPKRRKMGSTRRSQLDRKQQDEKRQTDDNVAIFDSSTAMHEKESIAIVNEDAETLSTGIFVEQEEIGVSVVSPVEQPNEDSAERQKVAQEEVLQTEQAALIEGMNTGATMQNPQSITSEGTHQSSPGKRRKMGSTRKNLTSKKVSPPEEIVTAINVGKEVVSSSSNQNNENKEHSGLLVHAAPVHEQPPDEKTPLSQQDNQENLRSEPELEVSSHPDLMTEEAAIARRRKMGSHRKPHTDQSVKQGKEKEENLPHPMEEQRAESPKLGRISEVSERDASAFNIKGNSRPMSQKIPPQLSQPSTNVRRVQQSNIRLAAGYDPSASKYEVVMIGDSSVGKTSFMQRAQSGRFSPDIPASIGMDSYKWPVVVDGRTVVLHLWDTAGQERFHSMTKQIFHRAQAFLLMYDITCAQTFTAVSYWANCIKEGAGENVVILLLGNKSDNKERKVKREEGELLAQENGFVFIECSAATGENVIEALETVARLLSQKTARREEPLELRKPEPKIKKCC